MKTPLPLSHTILAPLAAALLLTSAGHAAISSINTPGTSVASINFDDTTSLSPPPGALYPTSTSPWTGAIHSLPFTTDPTTFDTAQGNIAASFAGVNYAITFTNVLLNQALLNTGFAQLVFQFNVEFQLDAGGLPSQPTLFPSFTVNGTVQTGGFAFVTGFINYNGVNADGTANLLDTVNYNAFFSTPGGFSSTVTGVPGSGTTAALAPNSTLTLDGVFTFIVDPASISAESQMVPEPGSAILAILAGVPLLLRRRRA